MGGSMIPYFNVETMRVESDLTSLVFKVHFPSEAQATNDKGHTLRPLMYYRYDVDKLEMYMKILADPHATELYHDFLTSITNYHGTDIDFIYSKFGKYMCYALIASFSKKYSRPNNKFPVNAW